MIGKARALFLAFRQLVITVDFVENPIELLPATLATGRGIVLLEQTLASNGDRFGDGGVEPLRQPTSGIFGTGIGDGDHIE